MFPLARLRTLSPKLYSLLHLLLSASSSLPSIFVERSHYFTVWKFHSHWRIVRYFPGLRAILRQKAKSLSYIRATLPLIRYLHIDGIGMLLFYPNTSRFTNFC